MPISLQLRRMRKAISPRLAINSLPMGIRASAQVDSSLGERGGGGGESM
jgi:hypothetical protein